MFRQIPSAEQKKKRNRRANTFGRFLPQLYFILHSSLFTIPSSLGAVAFATAPSPLLYRNREISAHPTPTQNILFISPSGETSRRRRITFRLRKTSLAEGEHHCATAPGGCAPAPPLRRTAKRQEAEAKNFPLLHSSRLLIRLGLLRLQQSLHIL